MKADCSFTVAVLCKQAHPSVRPPYCVRFRTRLEKTSPSAQCVRDFHNKKNPTSVAGFFITKKIHKKTTIGWQSCVNFVSSGIFIKIHKKDTFVLSVFHQWSFLPVRLTVKYMRVPFPGSDSTQSFSRNFTASSLAMASPRPLPATLSVPVGL